MHCVSLLKSTKVKCQNHEPILIPPQLVQWHGLEAERHLLRCLISCVDFSKGELSDSSAKDYFQAKLLKQECNSLLSKPSFISTLCFAIDNPLHHQKVFMKNYLLLLLINRMLT